ncbi:lactoylglutathione lyase [Altererythrobacter salegens]|uniref:Lactoylglutathione lyase n=1 Tax=Croceibacterium salegens TaxID=1737568 RepID=A0A6I4SYL2_9SPHN|nr:VOC family protein [Croceibacterium salegens]MXO60240.1 lactoylglutathione lyase [Croceibacterium salegens]
MSKMIFVNLPVADLAKSMAFYEALGFVNEPRFTDETAAAMQWSDTIVVMLLTHPKWKSFTSKAIVDAKASAQVMLCIGIDSRAAVDAITEAAAGAGGLADPNPPQDYGFMYGRSFEDPDGHIWEPMWMDPKMASGEMAPPEHQPA